MKTKKVPCPHPGMYDAGRCCGECQTDNEDIVRAVRNIMTYWNFGPTLDREALVRIHAFVGDNVQNTEDSRS